MYVPPVTLSKENDTIPLEKLKSGFKKTIKWNKYRSQMTIQPQNDNLIMKIVQALEDSNILLKEVTRTIKNETKE